MQVIKLSCTLNKVTYKHALTHATSWQTLGFHNWNRPPVDDCIRYVDRGERAGKLFVNVHFLSRGRSAWRPKAGFQAEAMLSVRSCLCGWCYRVEGNMLQHVWLATPICGACIFFFFFCHEAVGAKGIACSGLRLCPEGWWFNSPHRVW